MFRFVDNIQIEVIGAGSNTILPEMFKWADDRIWNPMAELTEWLVDPVHLQVEEHIK